MKNEDKVVIIACVIWFFVGTIFPFNRKAIYICKAVAINSKNNFYFTSISRNSFDAFNECSEWLKEPSIIIDLSRFN